MAARPCSAGKRESGCASSVERAPPGHGVPEIVWPSGSEGDSSNSPAASAFVFGPWMMASTTHKKIPTRTNILALGPSHAAVAKT